MSDMNALLQSLKEQVKDSGAETTVVPAANGASGKPGSRPVVLDENGKPKWDKKRKDEEPSYTHMCDMCGFGSDEEADLKKHSKSRVHIMIATLRKDEKLSNKTPTAVLNEYVSRAKGEVKYETTETVTGIYEVVATIKGGVPPIPELKGVGKSRQKRDAKHCAAFDTLEQLLKIVSQSEITKPGQAKLKALASKQRESGTGFIGPVGRGGPAGRGGPVPARGAGPWVAGRGGRGGGFGGVNSVALGGGRGGEPRTFARPPLVQESRAPPPYVPWRGLEQAGGFAGVAPSGVGMGAGAFDSGERAVAGGMGVPPPLPLPQHVGQQEGRGAAPAPVYNFEEGRFTQVGTKRPFYQGGDEGAFADQGASSRPRYDAGLLYQSQPLGAQQPPQALQMPSSQMPFIWGEQLQQQEAAHQQHHQPQQQLQQQQQPPPQQQHPQQQFQSHQPPPPTQPPPYGGSSGMPGGHLAPQNNPPDLTRGSNFSSFPSLAPPPVRPGGPPPPSGGPQGSGLGNWSTNYGVSTAPNPHSGASGYPASYGGVYASVGGYGNVAGPSGMGGAGQESKVGAGFTSSFQPGGPSTPYPGGEPPLSSHQQADGGPHQQQSGGPMSFSSPQPPNMPHSSFYY
eukprot:TRINITY_DN12566_c0_g2_i1.p1 TRINITY_DN12566_c0_g2~~TRINITY_DN12566_c0_g2_i1.p1  ORF type:complete len:623 (+),score=134.22 TRINITY_DN12566_c0_g2_i1:105-1973(+)